MNFPGTLRFEELAVGRRGRPVVSHLTGEFAPGRLHLVLGRAGSGKTTLLSSIAGFLAPVSGRMTMGEGPWQPAGRVGLAFQNPETMFFCATVGEEVTFALRERGDPRDGIDARGKEWLCTWGLDAEAFWDRNPFHLSGGEKRRVALAAATIFKPDLILLDEPLAGLDPQGALLLQERIRELARDHLVVVVTHDPESLFGDCGQILLLEGGRGFCFSDARAFLRSVVAEPERYPLPDWYLSEVGSLGEVDRLPLPVVEDLGRLLKDKQTLSSPLAGMEKVQERTGKKLDK